MTSTERAKAFLSNKVKKTALVILPLAAAAISAHAGIITFSYNSGSSAFLSSGFASVSTSGLAASFFPTGIALYGNAQFTVESGGTASGSTCGGVCAGAYAYGSGSGTFPSDTLPVGYDFSLADTDGNSMVWSLSACINFEYCNSVSGSTIGSGGNFDSSFNISGLSGVTLTDWSINLQVDFASGATYSSGAMIDINIPGGATLTLGPVNTTPEPGAGWLVATAGAALALLRKRLFRRRAASPPPLT